MAGACRSSDAAGGDADAPRGEQNVPHPGGPAPPVIPRACAAPRVGPQPPREKDFWIAWSGRELVLTERAKGPLGLGEIAKK